MRACVRACACVRVRARACGWVWVGGGGWGWVGVGVGGPGPFSCARAQVCPPVCPCQPPYPVRARPQGPNETIQTIYELGMAPCEWSYTIRNSGSTDRTVHIVVDSDMFDVTCSGTEGPEHTVRPGPPVDVCLQLRPNTNATPTKVVAQSHVSAVVPGTGGSVVLHSAAITVYVLPEPVIRANAGVRHGDEVGFQDCVIVHNEVKAYEGGACWALWARACLPRQANIRTADNHSRPPPPRPDQSDHRGKKQNLQKGKV